VEVAPGGSHDHYKSAIHGYSGPSAVAP